MNFRPCTVEHGFRKFALDTYPGLRRNPSHPRLLNTLLFPSLVDRDTGDPVLSSGVLAHVEGKEHQLVSGHYNGTKYIKQYMSDTGHHFELTQHNRKQHKACTVPNLRLDPRLEEALEQELRAMPSDPVDFATGRKITRQSTADQRKEDLRMAEQYPSKYAETQAAIA